MKSRTLAVLCALILTAGTLAGCGGSDTSDKKEETKTVTSYDDHGQPTTVTTTKEGAPDSVEQTTYQDTV